MLIKQVCRKNVIFLTIGIFKTLVLSINDIFAMAVTIYCKKLHVLIMLLLFMSKETLREFIFGT